jgi:D-amino peptidase
LPLKAIVVADMEGVSGISTDRVSWVNCHMEDWEPLGRDRMTADVVAAVRGALAGGAEAVTIFDFHDTGDSIRSEALPPGATLRGIFDYLVPFGGLDRDHGVLLLVGAHAKAAPSAGDPGPAIFPHTVHAPIADLRYGGRSVGEIGMVAGLFGTLGVPLGLVTGDRAACEEARALCPAVESVPVKERLADGSERLLPEDEARALIASRAEAAVRDAARKSPVTFPTPLRLELTLRRPEMTSFELPPYMDRVDETTVGSWALSAFHALLSFYEGFQPCYMPVVRRLEEEDTRWIESLKARYPSVDWSGRAFYAARQRAGLALRPGCWTAETRRGAEALMERWACPDLRKEGHG